MSTARSTFQATVTVALLEESWKIFFRFHSSIIIIVVAGKYARKDNNNNKWRQQCARLPQEKFKFNRHLGGKGKGCGAMLGKCVENGNMLIQFEIWYFYCNFDFDIKRRHSVDFRFQRENLNFRLSFVGATTLLIALHPLHLQIIIKKMFHGAVIPIDSLRNNLIVLFMAFVQPHGLCTPFSICVSL